MEKTRFRQNVDPSFRRQTNKNLSELTSLRTTYEQCKKELETADQRLNREKSRLDEISVALETARNALSNAQEEIDADYLPEGAQPRARIENRDRLLLVKIYLVLFFPLLIYHLVCSTKRSSVSSSEKCDSSGC
jgi:exonuclease VII small subunit